MSAATLRERIAREFLPRETAGRLAVTFMSFGFKYGPPREEDLAFDVRFLPNPHYVPELRELTGEDPRVVEYVARDGRLAELCERLYALLDFLLPQYVAEGRAHLVIAIGCTGGRHRSVAIAEALARYVSATISGPVAVIHRDVQRGQASLAPTERVQDAQSSEADRDSVVSLELKDAASAPPPSSVGVREGASDVDVSRAQKASRGPQ
jgi:RNase adaptor protein for sRNA GlmZ degradation